MVDLRSGAEDIGWNELLDSILADAPDVDRVQFLVSGLTPSQEELLDSLVRILTIRGVNVERRHVSEEG